MQIRIPTEGNHSYKKYNSIIFKKENHLVVAVYFIGICNYNVYYMYIYMYLFNYWHLMLIWAAQDTRAHRPAICARNRCTISEQPLQSVSTPLDIAFYPVRTLNLQVLIHINNFECYVRCCIVNDTPENEQVHLFHTGYRYSKDIQ